MPQDVKRVNNLAISNLPEKEEWQPPSYAKPSEPTGEWQAPDYASPAVTKTPEEQPGFIERAWTALNKPLVDVTPEMRQAMDAFSVDHPVLGAAGEFGTGMLTGQSAPLTLGLEALTGGAIGSQALGLNRVANALKTPGKVAAVGMGGMGAIHALGAGNEMLNEPSWENAGKLTSGLLEGGMGMMGLSHLRKPPSEPLRITNPTRLLGPGRIIVGNQGLPERKLLGPGRTIIPPEPKPAMPPEFTAVGEEPPYSIPRFNPTEGAFNRVRHRQNMGLDVPSLPHGIKVEEPQFAESGKGGVKIGADVRSLGKVLGSSLYKGDISKIATKELLQNSLDAVRHLGKNGEVTVRFNRDPKDKYVEVRDNGRGLSMKEIQTVFTDLGSSGKREDENAVGGFGLAKAAPLLGGERVKVTSVVKEGKRLLEHTFEGTPDDLLNGVQVKTRELKEGTTGTTVRTYVPEKSGFWDAQNVIKGVARSSPGLQAKVKVVDAYGEVPKSDEKHYTEEHEPVDLEGAHKTTLSNPTADVDIIIPKNAKYAPRNGVRYDVANNGMFQNTMQYGYQQEPGIPDKIIVNIRSKVPEGHPDYPFTANREELRGQTHDQVNKYIEENIVRPAQGKRVEELRAVYQGMPKVELPGQKGSRPFFVYDVNQKFSKEELKYITEHPDVVKLATHISDAIHEAMEATGNEAWDKKLEKVGLIFDEGLRGIHIPHPGAGHSAILINPFQIMAGRTPEQASAGIMHVILHELAHVEGGGHDEEFTTRLADIYEQYGAQKALDMQNKFLKAIENEGGHESGYKPEIDEVLRRYEEARGRESTGSDPLRGTGISAKNPKSTGKGSVSGSSKTGPDPVVVDRLINALKEAGPKREEQEDLYSQERARRFAKAEGYVKRDAEGNIKNPGRAGFYKQLGALKGRLPQVDFERTQMKPGDVDHLIDAVTDNQYLLPGEKIRAKMALLKILTAKREELPQRSELRLLGQVFGSKFDDVVEMHGGLGGPLKWEDAKDLINAPKAIMASIDMSAPLRQGLPLIHRKEWWKSIGPMISMFKDQKVFDASQQALKDRPNYLLGKAAGLKLTDVGVDPNMREEAYGSKLANKIPGVKASERAYVGFLNKLRADTFDALIKEAENAGMHKKDIAGEVARFVNIATGRGQLPGNMDAVANGLNAAFFSPRLIASRVQMMDPRNYVKGNKVVRQQFLRSALATAAAGTITSGLMAAMGAKTDRTLSDNKGTPLIPIAGMHGMPGMPVNADFMKSRFGNSRLENFGGFLPYVTYLGRMLSGERQSSTTGKMYVLGRGFNAPTRATITEDFLANKLSPVASVIWKMLKQKDPNGNPYEFTPTMKQSLVDISNGKFDSAIKNAKSGEVGSLFIPMFLGDMIDIYKDDPSHFPLGIGSFFGTSLQTYPPTPNKTKKFRLSVR